MNRLSLLLIPALALSGCAGWEVVAVPPGESVLISLAQRGEPLEPIAAWSPTSTATAGRSRVSVPEIRPPMPSGQAPSDTVGDYYAVGEFCLNQQKYPEAIEALERAVKIDPQFADAWNRLAMAYQETGDSNNALVAFKKYKALAAP